MLVGIEHGHALAGLNFNGDDILLSTAAVDGRNGALVAHQSQFVLLLAGNVVFDRQIFRGKAHMITCDRAAQAFLRQGIHHLHIAHAEAGAAVQAKIRRAGHDVSAYHHG